MKIAEHSVKLSLLPRNKACNILDLGCAGFEFTDYFRNKGHKVVSVDIQHFPDKEYYCLAIGGKDGRCGIEIPQDLQAAHVVPGDMLTVMSLETFSKHVGVDHWHVIKMDIEGSEIGVLKNAKHPIADQVSVEFHAHTGRQTKVELDILLDWLSNWYYIENRYWEERHCAGKNYWDVLLIKKNQP